MLWFIHAKVDSVLGSDTYQTMTEQQASSTSEGFEAWLNYNGYKLTSRKFKTEEDVVRYAERLLNQNNLPDVVRSRLRAYIDRYYNSKSFLLDSLDSNYNPTKEKA